MANEKRSVKELLQDAYEILKHKAGCVEIKFSTKPAQVVSVEDGERYGRTEYKKASILRFNKRIWLVAYGEGEGYYLTEHLIDILAIEVEKVSESEKWARDLIYEARGLNNSILVGNTYSGTLTIQHINGGGSSRFEKEMEMVGIEQEMETTLKEILKEKLGLDTSFVQIGLKLHFGTQRKEYDSKPINYSLQQVVQLAEYIERQLKGS